MRYFRAPRQQNSSENDWESQLKKSGGNFKANQHGECSKNHGWQQQARNRTPFYQRKVQNQLFSPASLTVKNMFDVLGKMGIIGHP